MELRGKNLTWTEIENHIPGRSFAVRQIRHRELESHLTYILGLTC